MNAVKPLRFNEKGTFRILMISDFHCGAAFNPKLTEGMSALLDATKPDFVMIGGDQCLPQTDMNEMREYFSRVIKPITDRKVPWAAIFGNHDNEMGHDVEDEMEMYMTLPGCLAEKGPIEISGTGNYVLPVYSCDGKELKYNLWALDSHRNFHDYYKAFGLPDDTRCILPKHFAEGADNATPMPDQVFWYYNKSIEIEKEQGRKIPAVMFMHTPVQEFCHIYRNPEHCGTIGSKREMPGCSELNSGLFMTCLARGDVRGMFFGHEHLINLQGVYCGITLATDSALGYNMSAHDDLRGGRVIDLFEDGSMETNHVTLWSIMGKKCMRNPDYFEGGCKYFIRDL